MEVSKKLGHKNLIRAHFFFLEKISCKKQIFRQVNLVFPIMERRDWREELGSRIFSAPQIFHIYFEDAKALNHLHAHGIVHWDL